jgi:hypothetical protein
MIRMSESAVEGLTPVRAAELARVLELQSEWENLAAERQDSTARLQGVQRAFDIYRSRLLAYTGRENGQAIPELALNKSTRLRAWCRTVRAILLRAEGPAFPAHIMAKTRRVVGRLASRFPIEPPATTGATGLVEAIQQLEGVIAWCDLLEQRPAHEVGAGVTSPGNGAGGSPLVRS